MTDAMHIIRMCSADVMCHAKRTDQSLAAWRYPRQSSVSLGIHKIDWLASYHLDNNFHMDKYTNAYIHDVHINHIHRDHITYECEEL